MYSKNKDILVVWQLIGPIYLAKYSVVFSLYTLWVQQAVVHLTITFYSGLKQ